jgi:tetratricopeptide (TPR) repeat protein
LHLLNQALLLCPSCEAVHVEIARNLWQLGLRRQALLEWRSAVVLQPRLFTVTLNELFRLHATPEEMTSLASSHPKHLLEVAQFLRVTGRPQDALVALAQAEVLGAPREEILIARAWLQLDGHQDQAASQTIAAAKAAGIHDTRIAAMEAHLELDLRGAEGADRALEILDAAAAAYPDDVSIQRTRLDLITRFEKWRVAPRAVEAYKQALYARDGVATEGHIAAARILGRLRRWTDALGEYRIALADQPTNVTLWMEYGGAAESGGRVATAREAFDEAGRLSPNSPDVKAALLRLEEKRRQLTLDSALGAASP